MNTPAALWQHTWQRAWQGLSREARDTLWLLVMLALVLAPHASHLPLWCSLGAAAALLWRARLAWQDAPLPPRWWLVAGLIASVALTWLSYHTLMGRQAGITLVVILTTLKCLELRARRDALVCLYLGFFLIFTQFLYSQSIGTAALMLLAVWGLLCSLILGQRPLGRPPLREVGGEALRAMVRGLPLMVLLFVFFPRFGPLWSLPGSAQARTGLSESVQLGQVASLAQDSSIAMRLQFDGPRPLPSQLYFRGPTLDDFDGRRWLPAPPSRERMALDSSVRYRGTRFNYTATIEPHNLKIVPLLEGTYRAQVLQPTGQPPLLKQGLNWWRVNETEQRMQVRGAAFSQTLHGPTDTASLRWLKLPAGLNPRTVAWAQAWQAQPALAQASPRQLASSVLAHIRQGHFRYTLSPGQAPAGSMHVVDDFWMDSQAGFCEHFSSAFVVVMRAMSVPARVVTGYQGADINPVDGQYVVRNSHAHAWAEILSPGEGWLRVDPTAAVAPERIERSTRPPQPSALPGALGQLNPATWHSLRALRDTWEAVDHRWNVWVLQYSNKQQMDLLRTLGWPEPDTRELGQMLAIGLAALSLGGALLAWLGRQRPAPQPWLPPLLQLHRTLQKLAPPPAGPQPASASSWHAHLRQHWAAQASLAPCSPHATHHATNDATPVASLSATQQALLKALSALDALRYGPQPQASAQQVRRTCKPLLAHISTLSAALVRAQASGQPKAPTGAHSQVSVPP